MPTWTSKEVERLEEIFPTASEDMLVEEFDRSLTAIETKAYRLDMTRDEKYRRIYSVRESDWLDVNELNDEYCSFLSGFVAGEGTFNLLTSNNRDRYKPSFAVQVADNDKDIIYDIRDTLCCGNIYTYDSRRPSEMGSIKITVSNYGDLYKRVIPFFERYDMYSTRKQQQFIDMKEYMYNEVDPEMIV